MEAKSSSIPSVRVDFIGAEITALVTTVLLGVPVVGGALLPVSRILEAIAVQVLEALYRSAIPSAAILAFDHGVSIVQVPRHLFAASRSGRPAHHDFEIVEGRVRLVMARGLPAWVVDEAIAQAAGVAILHRLGIGEDALVSPRMLSMAQRLAERILVPSALIAELVGEPWRASDAGSDDRFDATRDALVRRTNATEDQCANRLVDWLEEQLGEDYASDEHGPDEGNDIFDDLTPEDRAEVKRMAASLALRSGALAMRGAA